MNFKLARWFVGFFVFLFIGVSSHPDNSFAQDQTKSNLSQSSSASEKTALSDEGEEDDDEDDDMIIESKELTKIHQKKSATKKNENIKYSVTLSQEGGYQTRTETKDVIVNRSNLRLKWRAAFGNKLFRFDGNVTYFHNNDHRTEADEEKDYDFEGQVREAYFQISLNKWTVTVGQQVLVWGEADGAVVTDVISARNQSELFFIPIQSARLGQPMLKIDHYAKSNWTFFIVPLASVNQIPEKDTLYDVNPFLDSTIYEIQDDLPEFGDLEGGIRWKKTVGSSDISFMLAVLRENQIVYENLGTTSSGKVLLSKRAPQFAMIGMAWNWTKGAFLWKGEVAFKKDRSFQHSSFAQNEAILKKDIFDSALGMEYTSNDNLVFSVEVSNQQILAWNTDVSTYREYESTLYAILSKQLLHDTLKLQYTYIRQLQDHDAVHQSEISYKATDNLKLDVKYSHFSIIKENSNLWVYRKQDRVSGTIAYTF
ncbi:MAG: hypothetical protein ACI86H_000929 [bacterium]|jgi:hypothetical protein